MNLRRFFLRSPFFLLGGAAAAFLFSKGAYGTGAPDATPLAAAEALYARYRKTNDASDLARAEAAIAKGLAQSPADYALLKFRLRLFLPHHRFEEMAAEARRLKALRPDDTELDGALGDASFELGRYDEAFASYDRFLDTQRSTASLSRAALAKEIVGDLPGALLAMDLAARAALPSDPEAYAWCRVRAARLLLKLRRYEDAEGRLVEALLQMPKYPAALAAAAEIAARKGMLDTACRLAEESFALFPDFSVAAALVDYREAMEDATGAARATRMVRTLETLLPEGERKVHRLLALFEADHGDAARAVAMTAKELETRKDVGGFDAYAWALHRAKRSAEALAPIHLALARGTVDPLLFFHAGAIEAAAGETEPARRDLTRAIGLDPTFHVRWAKEATRLLVRLGGAAPDERLATK